LKSNITLIGMPGAGKSTTGVILAKILGMGFIDTDVRIQTDQGKTLQQIVDESGHLALRAVEERIVRSLDVRNHVIATGGSVVYSKMAMDHLRSLSTIVFLKCGLEELRRRIRNFDSRGIARKRGQSFDAVFRERQPLYRKYAELTVDCETPGQEQLAARIAGLVRPPPGEEPT
jgi:shikimate kinase